MVSSTSAGRLRLARSALGKRRRGMGATSLRRPSVVISKRLRATRMGARFVRREHLRPFVKPIFAVVSHVPTKALAFALNVADDPHSCAVSGCFCLRGKLERREQKSEPPAEDVVKK